MLDSRTVYTDSHPEERALLDILREQPPADLDRANLSLLWEHAERQHVAPFAASWMLTHPVANSDDRLLQRMESTRYATITRNLRILAWQDTIRKQFEQEGVAWIALKGPVFTMRYYADIAQRVSSDLDLLVRPSDAPHADAILRNIFNLPGKPLRIQNLPLDLAPHHHKYIIPDTRILLELHWLHDDRRYRILSTEAAFEKKQQVLLEGTSFPVFSPEDTLLHYALHGFVHRWSNLSHLLNVQRILKKEEGRLDWEYLLRTASKARKSRAFTLALALANLVFHTPLPAGVEQRISNDRTLTGLTATARANFSLTPPAKKHIHELLFCFRGLESGTDRLFLLVEAFHKLIRGKLLKDIH